MSSVIDWWHTQRKVRAHNSTTWMLLDLNGRVGFCGKSARVCMARRQGGGGGTKASRWSRGKGSVRGGENNRLCLNHVACRNRVAIGGGVGCLDILCCSSCSYLTSTQCATTSARAGGRRGKKREKEAPQPNDLKQLRARTEEINKLAGSYFNVSATFKNRSEPVSNRFNKHEQ